MSVPFYLQRGIAAQDGLVLQTPAGTFTAGKVNGDFTKQLTRNLVGNQSVAGITITEIDGTNNAGVYAVSIADSSIPAANGTYILKVYLTADPTYSFEQIYVVTTDGLPGSMGPVQFTSSANDGRVTDGVNPIEDANVYLSKSPSYLTVVQTDATGNWSQYFSASFGTVNITVVKSGYVQATGTLTIGASTATGPGFDLVMTAITGASQITASEFWSYLRRQAQNKPGTQADQRIKDAGNKALMRVAGERDWSWYLRRGFLAIQAPYTTGTISISQGAQIATLSGGTFPSWAASGKLFISGSTPAIDVTTRDSGTQLTLAGVWNNASVSGASYVLFQDTYQLPYNLARFGWVLPGQNWGWGGGPVPIEVLWRTQNVFTTGNSFPSMFAIANGELSLYPYPSQAATFGYTYRAGATELTSSGDTIDIDPSFKDLLWKAGAYEVAVEFGEAVAGKQDDCWAAYQAALQLKISNEKTPVALPGTGDTQSGFLDRPTGHIVNRWY